MYKIQTPLNQCMVDIIIGNNQIGASFITVMSYFFNLRKLL